MEVQIHEQTDNWHLPWPSWKEVPFPWSRMYNTPEPDSTQGQVQRGKRRPRQKTSREYQELVWGLVDSRSVNSSADGDPSMNPHTRVSRPLARTHRCTSERQYKQKYKTSFVTQDSHLTAHAVTSQQEKQTEMYNKAGTGRLLQCSVLPWTDWRWHADRRHTWFPGTGNVERQKQRHEKNKTFRCGSTQSGELASCHKVSLA